MKIIQKRKLSDKTILYLLGFNLIEKSKYGEHRKLKLFGIPILSYKRNHKKSFSDGTIMWRNDDVAFDSDLNNLKKLCKIFHDLGYIQTHGITLYGTLNTKAFSDGTYRQFKKIKHLNEANYDTIKNASKPFFIGNNKELIQYLNECPDKIALHGLYHTDYSRMTYEQQKKDILEGLKLLKKLFPNKEIKDFIAPFNRKNNYTRQICKDLGLRLSIGEGEHLEELINANEGTLRKGMVYRYHHQRFYPESKIQYNISLDKLKKYLTEHPIKN